MMRFSLMALVVGTFAVLGTQAMAADGYGRYPGRANHNAHHDDLDHRAYHRDLDHREAHRYPMSWRQHGRLHDNLDHEAYHDRLEHRSAHRNRAYSPYRRHGSRSYHGLGYFGRQLSFWFGY